MNVGILARPSMRSCCFLAACILASLCTDAAAREIQGRVFVDGDGDGISGESEAGLPDVAVSDGQTVVRTDTNGFYSIESEGLPFVFVSMPRGYRATRGFYASALTDGPIDFALTEWTESAGDTARFVQISDTHVTDDPESVRTFREDLAEIDAVEPRPAFVLATGDLVNIGREDVQFEGYVLGSGDLALPLFNLPGNHDLYEPGGIEHYHQYLGPDYYSFNFAECHFVLVNGNDISDSDEQAPLEGFLATGKLPPDTPEAVAIQHQWILQDLEAAPPGSTVIFATHFLPSPAMLRYYSKLGAIAVLSGHWHGHRVSKGQGVMDVNSPPLRFGGIDRHPRSFRIIEIEDGRLSNELRLGGFRRHATIVSPAGRQQLTGGSIPVHVNAYDSRSGIENVTVEITGQTVDLERTGKWTWTGEVLLPASASGRHEIIATIRAENRETWNTEESFEVVTGAPALNLKWVAQTGGFIGISSPQVGANGVFVGIDDSGLESCGVAAFGFDGSKRWFYKTDSAIKNNVVVSGGTVFAMSVAGTLHAIDEHTGKLLWKTLLDSERVRWETAATTVHGGVVHVGSVGNIAAVNATTGDVLWRASAGNDTDWWPTSYAAPVVNHDMVFLSNLRYGAHALDSRTGKLIWSREGKFAGSVVDDHALLTVHDGHPSALDLHTGATLWTGTDEIGANASKPALAGERVVIGSADGAVLAFSARDGSLLWRYQTGPSLTSLEPYKRGGSDVNSSPVVEGGVVYVGASDGVLHAISLDDGSPLATYPIGAPIASSPVIDGDTLYIGAYDGNVYAFSIRD